MNTPTHVVVSMLVLGRREHPVLIGVIVLGALLPDLAIIAFYAWQKLVVGAPEPYIWDTLYYLPAWQNFFDAFNSLPLMVTGFAIGYVLRIHWLVLLSASMMLHVLGDLPVHREDAHRHLFPLSDWTFNSPVSYWDNCHYGDWFALFEAALITVGIIVLWRRYSRFISRAIVSALGAVTAAFIIFVFVTWGSLAAEHECQVVAGNNGAPHPRLLAGTPARG